MGRADYLALGDWNCVCYECGRKRKASQMKKHWQGYWVCPEHWEPRQQQDYARAVGEGSTPPWTQPPPATYTFLMPIPPEPIPPEPPPSEPVLVDHLLFDLDGVDLEIPIDIKGLDTSGQSLIRAESGQSAKNPFVGQYLTIYSQCRASGYKSADGEDHGSVLAERFNLVARIRTVVTGTFSFAGELYVALSGVDDGLNYIKLMRGATAPNAVTGTGFGTGETVATLAWPTTLPTFSYAVNAFGKLSYGNGTSEDLIVVSAAPIYIIGYPLPELKIAGITPLTLYPVSVYTKFYTPTGEITPVSSDLTSTFNQYLSFSYML